MYEDTKDICDNYCFRFFDNVAVPAVQLSSVGRETRHSKKYYWNNQDRPAQFLFQYTLRGSGTLKTDTDVHILQEETAFFLRMPCNDVYCFDEDRNKAPWEFLYLIFCGNAAEQYYNYIFSRFGKVIPLPLVHPVIRALLELHEHAKQGRITSSFAADSMLFQFLCLLCSADSDPVHPPSQLVNSAIAYLDSNYPSQIALSQVAEYLGVSQSHFSREFIRHTGEQPIQYLTKLRLEKAAQMLMSTDQNLEYISSVCGFTSSNYFCKVFRKYMKIPPGEFRKQMQALEYSSIKI